MATTISYTNDLGEPITTQQFKELNDYDINYYNDGILKKSEHYLNREINYFTYYLDPGQTISDVLNEYSEYRVDIIERSMFGTYRVQDEKYYNKGVLKFYYKKIYNQDNNLVCEHEYDLSTMRPILDKTEKFLYVDSDSLAALGFMYNNEGKIKYIWGNWVLNTDQGQNGFINIADVSKYFPTLFIDYPYFENADFFPG
ncbi:hypothetical protein [Pedobacter steynii]|uniref:Uncharacterized protein n=1 Tax=Pedobacter steynii TaxID=430522 RepID=A0A1D7QBI3_9SPHI|nr:hypothetical protein [Pedobacter steynii]AOM75997.1 hypothetical protein BFS30_01750 [Pedobacter steynii]